MTSREPQPQVKNLENFIANRMKDLKIAIRWLGEARRFKNDFAAEGWKDGIEAELSDISTGVYNDAVEDVIRLREEINNAKGKLDEIRRG